MIALLASLVLSSPPEDRLIQLVRHLNQGCLKNRSCAQARGLYYATATLRPALKVLSQQAKRLGISPLFLVSWVQSESAWVSDAMSRHNRIKPHPTQPWEKPPPGRQSWAGLDLGLSQIHVPSRWAPLANRVEVQRLRDPAANLRALGEWVELSRKRCQAKMYKKCRQMLAATGVAVYRRVRNLGALMQASRLFLKRRVRVPAF